jgi:hypothetical protein
MNKCRKNISGTGYPRAGGVPMETAHGVCQYLESTTVIDSGVLSD